ncbi:MAG TPA: hypothetical protein VK901_21235 [Nitrospiraceae bacterium]|nr:hypothetical protein [Nitrospiraceae bacterium]
MGPSPHRIVIASGTTTLPVGLFPNGGYASHECDLTITVLRSTEPADPLDQT